MKENIKKYGEESFLLSAISQEGDNKTLYCGDFKKVMTNCSSMDLILLTR